MPSPLRRSNLSLAKVQTFGKENPLQRLPLSEIRIEPDSSDIPQEILAGSENPFDVNLLEPTVFELEPRQGDLLAKCVALPFVRRPVDAVGVQEWFLQHRLFLAQRREARLKICRRLSGIRASLGPGVQSNCTERALISGRG